MNLGRDIRFVLNRINEKLWVRPLVICLVSVVVAFLAGKADDIEIAANLPEISFESVRELLSILSSSMLVIAVFAVGSMISAYTSASNSATPRAFNVIVADDVSQNALSTFIGAFIYGNVALVALLNGYYERAGRFTLFVLTVIVFAFVIVSFVRWVDRIARLGRLGNTIEKIEKTTEKALSMHARHPTLDCQEYTGDAHGEPFYSNKLGYIQRVNVATLQEIASQTEGKIYISTLPGIFVLPDKPLLRMDANNATELLEKYGERLQSAFTIGSERTFDEDPRFGLCVLSEIASRALSSAVNDPGTAFRIIGTMVRLLDNWSRERDRNEPEIKRDSVYIKAVAVDEMFSDAFIAITRDGAGTMEVQVHLQKALRALSRNERTRETAVKHARLARRYAESELKLDEEKEWLQSECAWLEKQS